MSSLSSLCTDRNCNLENGAILAPTMHCVMLLVRGRVLFGGITVRECWIRSLLLAWDEQLL